MAAIRTTLVLTGAIQQIIYRQAWQGTTRRMVNSIAFLSSYPTGTFPRPAYRLWYGRGNSLTSSITFESMVHIAYRRVFTPSYQFAYIPRDTTGALDYVDGVYVQGDKAIIGRTLTFDYIDTT